MVSAEDLPNAVTLNSVAMNMARVLGAALTRLDRRPVADTPPAPAARALAK